MTRQSFKFLALGAVALPLLAAAYGGWAVITIDQLPQYVVARHPFTLDFSVRQHGQTLLSGLKATVEARSGASTLAVPAVPGKDAGHYSATLNLAQPGDWVITVNSGFGASRTTLLPLAVVEAGQQPPPPLADGPRGRQLFVAKGCFTCHARRDLDLPSIAIGPDLTDTKLSPEFLASFLANPQMIQRSGTFQMPNLHLSQGEIVALSAFLTAPAQAMR